MLKVGYFGTWERGYPRNEQVMSSLRRAGADVREIHQEVWSAEQKFAIGPKALPRLARAELRLWRADVSDRDVLLVGYPGQFDLRSAHHQRLPVAFTALSSLYDTLVVDGARFPPGTRAAPALITIPRRAYRAADALVADTAANAAYMAELAGLDRVDHVYVGAEEDQFPNLWRQPERFTVTFVGKLIPLHGLPVILEAARLLDDVPFLLVGDGQQSSLLSDVPSNVTHVPWIAYRDLAKTYAKSGVALGVFGESTKTERVIPNKAFQALAVGVPLITSDTPAARELLTNSVDALLVDRTPESLAAGIRRLAGDPQLATRLANEGRRTFERECSEEVLGRRWRTILERLI
jgi:glycosyltransferase involved in cell wall biosynthesis